MAENSSQLGVGLGLVDQAPMNKNVTARHCERIHRAVVDQVEMPVAILAVRHARQARAEQGEPCRGSRILEHRQLQLDGSGVLVSQFIFLGNRYLTRRQAQNHGRDSWSPKGIHHAL
jgi:hypothetical protein